MLLLQNYTFYLLILWVTVTQAYLPQRYTSINRVTKHQAIVARTSVEEGIPVPIGELVRPPSVREEIVIRPAKFHDLASIVKLRISVFYPSHKQDLTFHTNLLDKLRRRQDRGTICLSAYHALPGASSGKSSTLIGTVEFNDFDFQGTTMETVGSRKKLYVADLAIREDYRRFGVASKLLRRIEEYAELAGYHEIYLHVDLDNKVGQKLYLKNGYSEFPRILSAKLFTEAHLLRPAETYVMLYKNLNEQSCS